MDSDRDSVLESEDEKELTVRQFLYFLFFFKESGLSGSVSVNIFFSLIL